MFVDIFSELTAMFFGIFKTIAAAIAILLSIAVMLIVFKKYKVALFLEDPTKSERFNKWQAINGDEYDSIEESAKAYIEQVELANKFETLHRKERAKELFYERRDAYRYLKAMDRYKLERDEESENLDKLQALNDDNYGIDAKQITYDNGAMPNNSDYDDGYWASFEDDYYR